MRMVRTGSEDSSQSDEEIIQEYQKTCRYIRKGCNFDIQKCFIDGKPLIVEGSHLDPNLFVRQASDESSEEAKLEIFTPGPFDEEEEQNETPPIRKMREQMQKLSQKGSIIIPFLLTISP